MNIREYLKKNIVVFDGDIRNLALEKELISPDISNFLNITHPQSVLEIHTKYVNAGADIIRTNTLNSSNLKLKNSGFSVEEIITSGVNLAKKSGAKYIALDIGPIGQKLEPTGDIKFEYAYELFKNQIVAGEKLEQILYL